MLKKFYWDIAEYFAHKWFERLRIKSFEVAGLDPAVEVVYDKNGKLECLVVNDEPCKEYTPTYLYDVMFETSDSESEVFNVFVEAYNQRDAELLVIEDLMMKGLDDYTIMFVDEYKNFMPYFNTPPYEERGWK